jgi:hypothetical protein
MGSQIRLVTQLYDSSSFDAHFYKKQLRAHPPAHLPESLSATLVMISPSGHVSEVDMHDDGLHADLDADDGIYAGDITATEDGYYIAQAIFTGTFSNGVQFSRSTQQVMAVVSASIQLDGSAEAVEQDPTSDFIDILIGVKDEATTTTYRAYAEVYSSNEGQNVPVCWISSLVNSEVVNGASVVRLQLNKNWLTMANLTEAKEIQNSLNLVNVSLQDVETYILVSYYSEMPVTFANTLHFSKENLLEAPKKVITEEMLKGKRPAKYQRGQNFTQEASGKIMLVHGYCAQSNPWTAYSSDWTNALYFLSANSNDENDKFAQKVVAFAENQGVSSYSAVGYSQGGMVITHLYNYYWSGLDLPTNGRLLQSLVTPYLGSAAAGNIAVLGSILGVGCGKVSDLTHDGSDLWLTGITSDVKSSVYFYYVQYDPNATPKYCNSGANLFLSKPNDGVTEVSYAVLKGGNNMGSTLNQCHGNNMAFSPAFADSTRNKAMNSNAAR